MSSRPLKLDKYGISWAAFKELEWHCLQYAQKKAEIASGDRRHERDVLYIEIAANIAGGDYEEYLLRMVTMHIGENKMLKEMQYAIKRGRLHKMRVMFYVILYGLRNGDLEVEDCD